MSKTRRSLGGLLAGSVLLVGASIGLACGDDDDGADDGLDALRALEGDFEDTDGAEDEGWILLDGLNHCFDNPGVGGMGFHYINQSMLDTTVDESTPEAFVYAPAGDGLELAAVEFIVPAPAWDESGQDGLPQAFGREFHLNSELGVYVLHAWVYKDNPAGTFEDWNPQVSCPAAHHQDHGRHGASSIAHSVSDPAPGAASGAEAASVAVYIVDTQAAMAEVLDMIQQTEAIAAAVGAPAWPSVVVQSEDMASKVLALPNGLGVVVIDLRDI